LNDDHSLSVSLARLSSLPQNPELALQPAIDSIKVKSKKVNMDIAVRNRNHLTAMGNHMPYGITLCLAVVTFPPLPSQSWYRTQFSGPRGMQG